MALNHNYNIIHLQQHIQRKAHQASVTEEGHRYQDDDSLPRYGGFFQSNQLMFNVPEPDYQLYTQAMTVSREAFGCHAI